MNRLLLIFSVFLFGCPSPSVKKQAKHTVNYAQIVLVVTPDNEATTGQLRRYEIKEEEGWKSIGEPLAVTVGRSGLAWGKGLHEVQGGIQKKEGDGKAPSGIFRLTQVFGYEPPLDLTFRMPFVRANEILECVDDSNSKFYNQLVDSLNMEKDWTSSEFMRRNDHQYRWGVVAEHNNEQVAQGGSCIFLHIWRGPGSPTSGCTAMSEIDLLNIIHWLDEKQSPVLIQLTESDFQKWQNEGMIPDLKRE